MNSKSEIDETEVGLIPADWELKLFSDVIDINPRRTIKKGTEVKFVSMPNIKEFDKKIRDYSFRKFSGGSKFINGDTLMARITPSLENGKTAFVDILDKNEIGAGSTEFIVLAGQKDKIIPNYVYYLAISPEIRNEAIKSMTGTSGRQRVDNDVFNHMQILLPPLNEQEVIANFLSSMDQKIELNQKMNKTLEKIGYTIFKHWFIDFEFPDAAGKPYKSQGGEMVDSELGKIPEGWEIKKLSEICSKVIDGTHDTPKPSEDGYYLVTGKNIINNFIDFSQCYLISPEEHKKVMKRSRPEKGDIIFSNIGTLGRTTRVDQHFEYSIKNVALFKPLKLFYSSYIYQYFCLPEKLLELENMAPGTTQKFLSLKILRELELIKPSDELILKFNEIIEPILNLRTLLNNNNLKLSQTRDSLIPKLMSGQIRVNKSINPDQKLSRKLEALQ